MFALFFFTLITSKKIYLNGKYGTWSRDGKDAITLEQLSDGSYHVKHTGEQDFTVTAQDTVELIPGDKIKLAIDFNIKQGLGQIVYIPYDSQPWGEKTWDLKLIKNETFIVSPTVNYANIEKGILENASDEENRACVVERLHARNISSSLARFVACVVLIGRVRLRDEMIDLNLQASGECRGMIYDNEKGENGFGYDSMFQPEGYNVRMAELDSEEKNLISHRAKALRALSLELDSKLK